MCPVPKTQAARAAARLYAIRSKFIHLYNPSRPHTPTALGIIFLLLAILVVVAGNFIRKLYELDDAPAASRSGSGGRSSGHGGSGRELTPWVMAEIKKRQTEFKAGKTPEQTLVRYTKEAEGERKQMKDKLEHLGPEKGKDYRERKEKERAKELTALLGRLTKMKLTTVGVEGADNINGKAEGGGGAGSSGEGDGGAISGQIAEVAGAVKKKWGAWTQKARSRNDGQKKEKKERTPLGERLKRMILPVPSSSVGVGVSQQMAMMQSAMLRGGGESAMPAKGPGWEVADNPQAEAALAQSANNAENLAAKMRAGT